MNQRFDFLDPSYLVAVGVLLLTAFIAVGGDLGLQSSVPLIAAAWSLHLLIGLTLLRICVIRLSRWRPTTRWPDLALLATAGLLTSLLLTPVSLGVDQALLARGVTSDDPPLLQAEARQSGRSGAPMMTDHLLSASWSTAFVEEWVVVVGPSLAVALLLGLPALCNRRRSASPEPAHADAKRFVADPHNDQVPQKPALGDQSSGSVSAADGCLARLPSALGTDLIAARSELQYVRVYTTRGEALILGALKDVAAHGGAGGQLVHRSWWVANEHVRTLRRRGPRCMLTLSNGLEVPISRRRQQSLINQFGSSATLTKGTPS